MRHENHQNPAFFNSPSVARFTVTRFTRFTGLALLVGFVSGTIVGASGLFSHAPVIGSHTSQWTELVCRAESCLTLLAENTPGVEPHNVSLSTIEKLKASQVAASELANEMTSIHNKEIDFLADKIVRGNDAEASAAALIFYEYFTSLQTVCEEMVARLDRHDSALPTRVTILDALGAVPWTTPVNLWILSEPDYSSLTLAILSAATFQNKMQTQCQNVLPAFREFVQKVAEGRYDAFPRARAKENVLPIGVKVFGVAAQRMPHEGIPEKKDGE